MAQRLAIARGIVHDPEVVLFDEPFTGLDRGSAKRFAARIEDMRRQGRTLVLVTHDVQYAAQFGDAAIVLSGGRIVHTESTALDADGLERAAIAAGDAQA
jgi:ABC-type multidrug transport system ATPase subunit